MEGRKEIIRSTEAKKKVIAAYYGRAWPHGQFFFGVRLENDGITSMVISEIHWWCLDLYPDDDFHFPGW